MHTTYTYIHKHKHTTPPFSSRDISYCAKYGGEISVMADDIDVRMTSSPQMYLAEASQKEHLWEAAASNT